MFKVLLHNFGFKVVDVQDLFRLVQGYTEPANRKQNFIPGVYILHDIYDILVWGNTYFKNLPCRFSGMSGSSGSSFILWMPLSGLLRHSDLLLHGIHKRLPHHLHKYIYLQQPIAFSGFFLRVPLSGLFCECRLAASSDLLISCFTAFSLPHHLRKYICTATSCLQRLLPFSVNAA